MKKVVAVVAVLALGACSVPDRFSTGEAVGTLAGAAIGTIVGLQFGGGIGNVIFGILGGASGAVGGYTFGRQLDPSDKAEMQSSAERAMAEASDGQLVTWVNQRTGSAGTIMPVRTFYAGNGIQCRDFEASVAIDAGVGEGRGRACRSGSGAWQLATAG